MLAKGQARAVYVTGGTGYLGRALIAALVDRGHVVRALCRPGSAARLPAGCGPVLGDALDAASYASSVRAGEVFVHLVGVAHPTPAKAAAFRSVDLAAIVAAADNARAANAARLVYVSVAMPAPVMKAYVEARAAGEAHVRGTALPATILRPWYVIGPGHYWPLLLLPLYGLAALFARTRAGARRCGLVTRQQMVRALVAAVESRADGVSVVEVPAIRAAPPL
jgi:uncharacterized protein YbjT (DUF2867 family)